MMKRYRWLAGISFAAMTAWIFGPSAATSPTSMGTTEPTPVLVELFTSEGCSSCPPADQVLMRLAQEQPVGAAQIIVMSEHVDYWNRLGWSDPFSAAQFSSRQDEYARVSGRSDVYTPQMIVDGRIDLIGSNAGEALRAIKGASQQPKQALRLRRNHDTLHVEAAALQANSKDASAELYLALTEDKLASQVTRGENQGRRLEHTGVVRKLSVIGRIDSTTGFSSDVPLPLSVKWKQADMHAVVFLQSRKTRQILGASAISLSPQE